jgi:hypothetical protein
MPHKRKFLFTVFHGSQMRVTLHELVLYRGLIVLPYFGQQKFNNITRHLMDTRIVMLALRPVCVSSLCIFSRWMLLWQSRIWPVACRSVHQERTHTRGSVLPSQWTLISGYHSNNTTSIHTYKARTPFENRICHTPAYGCTVAATWDLEWWSERSCVHICIGLLFNGGVHCCVECITSGSYCI